MYEFELAKAADELIKNMFAVKEKETVVITYDTLSDPDVVQAVAASAHSAGAYPMSVQIAAPEGIGKAADPDIPVKALTGLLMEADVWIEFNKQWLLYSTPFEIVQKENQKLRYMCLVEFNKELMVRTIGKVDSRKLRPFMNRITELTRQAKTMRAVTSAGTDVSFEIEPSHRVQCDCGDASVPGTHFLTGQINVVPRFGTVNGTIVFDGSICPPFGRIVTEPVTLVVKNSRITDIQGGSDAAELLKWLKSLDDENMFKMAHIAYAFNPGAQLTGNIVEDERVWGATEWGVGYVSAYDAPPVGQDAKSHFDGICLNSTIWLDGRQILKDGAVTDPELKELSPR